MENASKALLIAAAVLIVILLIAFGMQILNSADTSSQVDSATATQEMQAFNGQITAYLGNSRAGSTIPNLLAIVNNLNKNYSEHKVSVTGEPTDLISGTQTAGYTPGTELKTNTKYSITATYDTDGYITEITIK